TGARAEREPRARGRSGSLGLGLRTLDRGAGLGPDLLDGDAGGELDGGEGAAPFALDAEDAELGDYDVDHAGPGERERAALQQLVLAVLGGVLHDHDYAADAGDKV